MCLNVIPFSYFCYGAEIVFVVILFVVPFPYSKKKWKDNGVVRMWIRSCSWAHGYLLYSMTTGFQVNVSMWNTSTWLVYLCIYIFSGSTVTEFVRSIHCSKPELCDFFFFCSLWILVVCSISLVFCLLLGSPVTRLHDFVLH